MTGIEYVGAARADRLTESQRGLLCAILNRYSDAGPAAHDASIQYFALAHTLDCIREARAALSESGVALADSIAESLATPTGVETAYVDSGPNMPISRTDYSRDHVS